MVLVNFQYWGAVPTWIIGGAGPTMLAVGVGAGWKLFVSFFLSPNIYIEDKY